VARRSRARLRRQQIKILNESIQVERGRGSRHPAGLFQIDQQAMERRREDAGHHIAMFLLERFIGRQVSVDSR